MNYLGRDRDTTMARRAGPSVKQLIDAELLARVQSILINAAEGRRNVGDDSQYNT